MRILIHKTIFNLIRYFHYYFERGSIKAILQNIRGNSGWDLPLESGRMNWKRKNISLETLKSTIQLNNSRYKENICTYSWHWVPSRCQVNRDDPGISRVIVCMIFRHQTNPICTKEGLPLLQKSCHPHLSDIFSDRWYPFGNCKELVIPQNRDHSLQSYTFPLIIDHVCFGSPG